ncbi:MAG: DotU family type IV/VI secretion system protein [Gemmatimonadota bacterium]|jgi:type VI secretion system protein ImpK
MPARGQLALRLQEAITVAVRLRTNRQSAADAASFRAHVKQLLARADQESRDLGYDGEMVRLAVYAYVAFLDESVMNSSLPMFADWPKQPLQEELFGDLRAGERFFGYLQELLGRQDSEHVADTLEVFELCLLLGFRGRYSGDDQGQLRGLAEQIQAKIGRTRGGGEPVSPRWQLPEDEKAPLARDPWVSRLVRGVAIAAGVAVVIFLVLSFALGGPVNEAGELARQIAP